MGVRGFVFRVCLLANWGTRGSKILNVQTTDSSATLLDPLLPENSVRKSSHTIGRKLQPAGRRTVRRKWVHLIGLEELSPKRNWDFGEFWYDFCLN